MREELRDRNGRLIGIITETGGYLEARDPGGNLKGRYDRRSRTTRDADGMLVGKGNLLAALLMCG
jgi:hypothetical protein